MLFAKFLGDKNMGSSLRYFLVKFADRLFRKKGKMINRFFEKTGVRFTGSQDAPPHIFSNISKGEPWLISIGSNTTISTNVSFVTHDSSISKIDSSLTDLFGEITIGDNCFIGQNSCILYGVSITNNVIVAAGSIVTKSILEPNVIVGGNPAKIIGKWENFALKKSFGYNLRTISKKELINLKNNNQMNLVKK